MAEIRMMVECAAPARTVFSFVASGDGLARWWAADVTETPSGAVEIGLFDRRTVVRLRAETMVIPARVAWSVEQGDDWAGTFILFELVDQGDRCRVYFAHAGWADESDDFLRSSALWGMLLHRLARAVEGANPGPWFTRSGVTAAV